MTKKLLEYNRGPIDYHCLMARDCKEYTRGIAVTKFYIVLPRRLAVRHG